LGALRHTCPLFPRTRAQFAEALQVIAKTLAENAGINFNDAISNLRSAHTQGKTSWGVIAQVCLNYELHPPHSTRVLLLRFLHV